MPVSVYDGDNIDVLAAEPISRSGVHSVDR